MNRQRRRASQRKLKVGDVVRARIGRDHDGNYYWFEGQPGDQPVPNKTIIYSPFATQAECSESQRLVLLGPQCAVAEVTLN